jgi:ketohexokinase
MRVVAVGLACIDIVLFVDVYPEEDSEVRVPATRKCRGGNATNSLLVAAQLGAKTAWVGRSTDPAADPDAV